ncbi:MAG: NADH-quinone oxidoreductase subunit J [Deltaproteobacteria bacterium]|nr:NADH-quinone oxidoreductase subunit J [Deltaproteobacteria bacterium]
MQLFFFYLFSLITLSGAVLVVAHPNTLSSAMSLIVSLFGVACLFVLLAAPFVATMQLLLYAGAIMVLFIFVIMLLNPSTNRLVKRLSFGGLLGILISSYLAVILVLRVVSFNKPEEVAISSDYGSLREVGQLLFSTYLVPFEVTSLLLLVAIIGAVVLGRQSLPGGRS